MVRSSDFEVVRDPLWNNIRVDREALKLLDTEPIQRLRYIRQLGHAFLVYPGATHSRFEHALGTYHLARRTLGLFQERGELAGIPDEQLVAVRLAALLHDVGHYPFSHALEEAGLPSHEGLAERHLQHPEVKTALADVGVEDLDTRLAALIRGSSASPLQGLIAGSLDLDKIEYLTRDARMCGVPYGTVDVDRLLHSLTIVTDTRGSRSVGVHEKGLSALESLLFAKYQMYRNVYWHHAVRSATVMFKRVVRQAIAEGALAIDTIPDLTDEELMGKLHGLPYDRIGQRLHRRQLYKRAVDLPSEQLPDSHDSWIPGNPALTQRVEDRVAEELGVAAGDVLIDYPAKPAMLAADLLVLTRDREVEPLSGEHGRTLLGIRQVAEALHDIARRLRVFVADPVSIPEASILRLVECHEAEVEALLSDGTPLLAVR
jgi:HD superfamily phosphohydrolase